MDKFAEIHVFLCVVEEGSFSAAGRKLQLSPSAISKLIARLETRLNVRLFERHGAAIRLTQEGEQFQHAGQRAIQALYAAENSVHLQANQISGVVRIHTALTTAKYLIAPHLPDFLDQHPQLRMDFVLGTERCDFAKQGIDIAIHSGRPTELSLIGRPLMHRPWMIAASPKYLERYGTPKRPEDLLHHRCLNFSIRTQWNRWCFQDGSDIKTIDIPNYIGANQGELLRTLALQGIGIVRLAHFNISADLARGALIPLLNEFQTPSEDDRFYLLYSRGRSIAPRVKAVIRFLTEALRERTLI